MPLQPQQTHDFRRLMRIIVGLSFFHNSRGACARTLNKLTASFIVVGSNIDVFKATPTLSVQSIKNPNKYTLKSTKFHLVVRSLIVSPNNFGKTLRNLVHFLIYFN